MLGAKIQQLRKEKGMSQEQLAAQLTVSRQAVSKWELGESVPDTENIVQLSKLFCVSIDFLLNDEFEKDIGITTVTETFDNLTRAYPSKSLMIIGLVLSVVGGIGNIVIWILSTTVLLQVPNAPVLSDTDTTHMSDTWLRDYATYVEHYNLEYIIGILWILLVAGAILLGIWLIRRKLKRKQMQ